MSLTIALAGRRIDATDAAKRRFPPESIDAVEEALTRLFRRLGATRLVCSAACGADLLSLSAAKRAGIEERHIVLPFAPETFYRTSVSDRPGDWKALYDLAISEARSRGELTVLDCSPGDDGAYQAATQQLVRQAAITPARTAICVVWEGAGHSGETIDHTLELAIEGRARGWPIYEVNSLTPPSN